MSERIKVLTAQLQKLIAKVNLNQEKLYFPFSRPSLDYKSCQHIYDIMANLKLEQRIKPYLYHAELCDLVDEYGLSDDDVDTIFKLKQAIITEKNHYLQTWLATQPPVKIHEFHINNLEEGIAILKQKGIMIEEYEFYGNGSINEDGTNYISEHFNKTDNEHIEFIYCVNRDNPFGSYYQTGKTLDYYKNQQETIKELYIFINLQKVQWLKNHPHLQVKVHEYTIDRRHEGYQILEQQGININRRLSDVSANLNKWGEKTVDDFFNNANIEHIDFIYCVSQTNPFRKEYDVHQPLNYYKHQKFTIKDLYIFNKSKHFKTVSTIKKT